MIVVALRRQRHGGNVRASLRLGEREGSDRRAASHLRQIALLEFLGPGKRYRTATEALHHEREVRKATVACQCFPGDHQI